MAHQSIDTQPIAYRGESCTAAKNFVQGTHRTCSPEETLARIEPYFPVVGLTRLADVTGLDRIGIPIVLATRPNAGYLAVDAGKGFTLAAAKVSAAMETIERYHGETVELPEICLSYADLAQGGYPVIPVHNLPFVKNNLFNEHQPERWVMGWDIANQQEVAAPAIMVFMKRFRWPRSEPVPFQATSNGLASGNHLLEALTAGLLEVIERDGTAIWQLALETFFTQIPLPRVRLDTIEYPTVREVLARFEAAQTYPVLFDCTTDTQVPTYMAWLYDQTPRGLGGYKGYGAHLDPEIAMLRALTEAAQGRLVYIAGARDDAFRHRFEVNRKTDASNRSLTLQQIPAIVDAREQTSEATATFEGDIRVLIEKLRRAGLEQVIVYDLTLPGFDLSVVRVIVPGLEGYKGMNFFKPGHRATSFLRKAAEGIRETS
jgi:ribosomal protein S12 methylthiotransferase accessory factor